MDWKKLRWIVVGVAAVVCVGAWVSMAIGYFVRVSVPAWVAIVTVAAFATEALIWAIAFAMGLKLVEARKKIWQWMKHPFRARGSAT